MKSQPPPLVLLDAQASCTSASLITTTGSGMKSGAVEEDEKEVPFSAGPVEDDASVAIRNSLCALPAPTSLHQGLRGVTDEGLQNLNSGLRCVTHELANLGPTSHPARIATKTETSRQSHREVVTVAAEKVILLPVHRCLHGFKCVDELLCRETRWSCEFDALVKRPAVPVASIPGARHGSVAEVILLPIVFNGSVSLAELLQWF